MDGRSYVEHPGTLPLLIFSVANSQCQNELPAEARPLCITIYADKTRLSSFGTAMGHPVMARIENFPDNIKNGKGLGGTEVIGWLPIVITLSLFTHPLLTEV